MITTPPKSSAAIYRKAAERIEKESNQYSCCAIEMVTGYMERNSYTDYYEYLFKPEEQEGHLGWWYDGNKEVRILALLLAAEICERGGLDK